jgi:hypothetical protein
MGKYIGTLTLILLLGSCTIIDIEPVTEENIIVELDGRLPMDVNGYYHLKLNYHQNYITDSQHYQYHLCDYDVLRRC